ncbi:YihY/virulence factor BrkB family protein [Kitasatospora sp. NBC_00085]|uniref:YhjD/YihY/BrkB family envelope integrity protein n=1 Tax=unclassified Kitasatospora TaxID=2633591 RepID=UPI00324A2C00
MPRRRATLALSPTGRSRGETAPINRERVIRTLTFWLRPAFALRVVNRFQKVVGFDRSMALASSALTALIPLAILCSSVLTRLSDKDVANRIIDRYGLTGGGAEAVDEVFASATGASASASILGTAFLVVSVLSFTRAMQRMFEQTWELRPLSVRNTPNGLRWALTLPVYAAAVSWLHAVLGHGRLELVASLAEVPLTAAFAVWSGRVLSAGRIALKDLVPFGVIAALLLAACSMGATFYLPRLFSSYATRYGAVGAVFAILSCLFCAMVVVVGSAALGREVCDELDRIGRGERPPDDEVRREWDHVLGQMRLRWRTTRQQISRRRRRRHRQRRGPSRP